MRSAAWPANLRHCQVGSPLEVSRRDMAARNWLFYKASKLCTCSARSLCGTPHKCCQQGSLACLDVGHQSPLRGQLLMDGYQDACTVLEADFGEPLADINYLQVPGEQQVFVCLQHQ